MTELFPNISQEARKQADLAWTIAWNQNTPTQAAKMLDAFTNYYSSVSKEEGIQEFLQFYFNLKMEELKNEDNSNKR